MISPPPTNLMHDGPQTAEEYIQNGQEYLSIYRDWCGLKPAFTNMLDVGCGIGRKTIPLVDYFDPHSTMYIGIDTKRSGIDWCRDNIGSRHHNFQFDYIDVYAPGYNPEGSIKPEDYHFDFMPNIFDFVVCNSVFTHMQVRAMSNYMRQIHTVMKIGGKALFTFFLLNAYVSCDIEHKHFPHAWETGRVANKEMPEQAIAYEEWLIDILLDAYGFKVIEKNYGKWSDTGVSLTYQDLVLVEKV